MVKWQTKMRDKYEEYFYFGTDYRPLASQDDEKFKPYDDMAMRFGRMINTINGRVFSEFQLEILENILPYLILQIYKPLINKFRVAILERYGIKSQDVHANRIVSGGSRRGGKTTVYISVIVSLALSLLIDGNDEFNIYLVSVKEESALSILTDIKRGMENCEFYKKYGVDVRWINNEIVIRNIHNDKMSGIVRIKIFSQGGGARGNNGNIIFIDEAEYIKWDTYNAVKSMANISNNFLISISSPPLEHGSWYSEEMACTDGSVKVIKFEVVCETCKKLPFDEMIKCLHKRPNDNPSKSKQARINGSKSTTNSASYAQEDLGVMPAVGTAYYPMELLNHLFDDKHAKDRTPISITGFTPKFYMAFFDPNAYGLNDYACVFACENKGKHYICSIDTINSKSYDEQKEFIFGNIRTFHYKIRKTTKIPLVLVIESQASTSSDQIKSEAQIKMDFFNADYLENVHFFSDIAKQKNGNMNTGTIINEKRLNEMTEVMSTYLACGAVCIIDDWTTNNKMGKDYVYNQAMKQFKQFRHFALGENSKRLPSGKRVKNNSGKVGKLNDDIVDCFHGVLYYMKLLLYNPEYKIQKENFGIN
jgi:hypothetical protein